ncbi:alanine racemase [Zavarzinia compransoris]|uniref:Alanine racemase n=1 Tax=Zavarzinia compransoris TaxID=1264899 RepID=A0A317E3S0_9PROT|nr:alanine racemase [Zavarzinia compransoris]PWR20053.1 alanine racemase [Zavarzinia compransoris]TDP44826.1 alanine racemase [Zavarzinia compransoris]
MPTTIEPACSEAPIGATTRLTIDLDAIAANWRFLAETAAPALAGAAVKADAYGLGAARVAPALYAAGCRHFFVAHLGEALSLRPRLAPDAVVYVLHGVPPGTAGEFAAAGITPILNSLGDMAAWSAAGKAADRRLPAALHIDTGMCRTGLSDAEVATLIAEPERLDGIELRLVISHLSCADDPANPMTARQRQRFLDITARLPTTGQKFRRALANSAGVLWGADYHFDLVRPGIALYGGNPIPGRTAPLTPVVRLETDILQVREIDPPEAVGYGAVHKVTRHTRVATVAVGYADGYLRAAGNRGMALVAGQDIPILGRISMDLMTIDVTDVPPALSRPGMPITLIGDRLTIDRVAAAMDTVSYELLTRLGRRFARHYRGSAA